MGRQGELSGDAREYVLTFDPSLTGEQVNRRKLLKSWSLHFEGVSLIAQIHAPYR